MASKLLSRYIMRVDNNAERLFIIFIENFY